MEEKEDMDDILSQWMEIEKKRLINNSIGLLVLVFPATILLYYSIINDDIYLTFITFAYTLSIIVVSLIIFIMGFRMTKFDIKEDGIILPRYKLKHMFLKKINFKNIVKIEVINNHWIKVSYLMNNNEKHRLFTILDSSMNLSELRNDLENKVEILNIKINSYDELLSLDNK
jgi:hypothetical protein